MTKKMQTIRSQKEVNASLQYTTITSICKPTSNTNLLKDQNTGSKFTMHMFYHQFPLCHAQFNKNCASNSSGSDHLISLSTHDPLLQFECLICSISRITHLEPIIYIHKKDRDVNPLPHFGWSCSQ